MEVWGGNQSVDVGFEVTGIEGWIHSLPYHGAPRGGDVHFVSMCGGGRISRFCVADVSGHGEDVADLARHLRRLMRRHVNKVDQTQFARTLNRSFLKKADRGRFATALLATYFAPLHSFAVCNIGHPRPYLYRSRTARWQALAAEGSNPEHSLGNIPFGVIQQTEYQQFQVELEPEDIVVITSDGVAETRNAAGEFFGEQRLLECLRSTTDPSPQGIAAEIRASIDRFAGSRPPHDDRTLMILRHNASEPPPLTLGHRLKMVAKMMGLTPSDA